MINLDKVSDPKALKEEILKLRHDLKERLSIQNEAERAKTEYMQNVAHQLTAPINAIKMNIESIRDPKVPVQRKNALLSSIYAQGTILVHLIKNFSLMSHLEADHKLEGFRDELEEVDLFRLCINLCNDFQPMGAYKKQKLETIEEDFRKNRMPKVRVIKNLIAQVIYNLLENAVKYGDKETTITIRLTVEPGFYLINIRSIGIPIGTDDIPKLFERGYRGNSASAKNPAGTGFGLYIAKRIAEIHHGNLLVQVKEKDTIFSLKLPKSLEKI